ncbi:helix-turn-helix domain-containing protein [Mammaliicoccus sciuri]
MYLYESKKYTINEIIKMTGVSKSTIYNIVNSQTE